MRLLQNIGDPHVDDGIQHNINTGEKPGHLGRVVHGESGDLESKELRYPSDDVDDEPRRPAGGEDEDNDEEHLDNLPPALHDPVCPVLLTCF